MPWAIADLETVGDALPALIEDAASRGGRLVVERRGVRLAVVVPEGEPIGKPRRVSDDGLLSGLAAVRARFEDQTEDEIERETARALAEVRAEIRSDRAVHQKAS